jgi:uncharacterized protein (DUF885 family)
MHGCSRSFLAVVMLALAAAAGGAQGQTRPAMDDRRSPIADRRAPADEGRSRATTYVPAVDPLPSKTDSELRDMVERLRSDGLALGRRYSLEPSDARHAAFGDFFTAWQAQLPAIPFDRLAQDGKVDYILLRTRLDYEQKLLARNAARFREAAPLMPYAAAIISLHEARRRLESADGRQAAATLVDMAQGIADTRASLEAGLKGDGKDGLTPSRNVARRAANMTEDLKRALDQWYRFHHAYDPTFSWWVEEPYTRTGKALDEYVTFLRERVLGQAPGEEEPIVGDPIGRQALLEDLAYEMMPYSPEELIDIANAEYAWCEAEMKRASRELGFGEDWKKALEAVKNKHVEPGRQPALVKMLAEEAVAFLEKHDLVTVPTLAKDVWRIEMMPPERQRVAPFFLGGEVIQVSYPTDSMEHGDKLMSMRGNNIHFSRATVHHELIPGHHLQGFMSERFNAHRRSLSGTPFWMEGWALYWEMLLWDTGFPQTPEDRVGMLFWRMHRTARIIFSLSFHLGKMTPQECIDFLVERVGHERFTAEGEVRRSFNGDYSPLYQVAYMIGGLQFRALHRELVGSGQMTNREFHDRILTLGMMPVEMVRAVMTSQPLARDHSAGWRFYQN